MFYSQFILAKKGPLGTIWIAAHLERKLRKNQVADTDIGESVDSILFPDVPIALRLSSHLLLGVVRIYNRKVNYLFDDCSETLLKIKQAFRSAAVDLPPEESKAPYHSITLPETFDLDDFELPDNDIFQGNFVDHHISSREQITLQDSVDGVTYSTSKFGLDERFGDGDASGLDLDEELFLDKIGTAGHASERSDPQSSVGPMTPLKQDEHPETRVDGVDDYADLMDYAQAPRTPGLVEEPNLSNVQEVSACDDHLESEYHLGEPTMIENVKNDTYGDKQEVTEEHGHQQSGGLDSSLSKPQGESPIEAEMEHVHMESPSGSKPLLNLSGEVRPLNPTPEVPCMEDSQNEAVNKDDNSRLPVDKSSDCDQGPYESDLEKNLCEFSEGVPGKDQGSVGVEAPGFVEIAGDLEKTLSDASDLPSRNQEGCFTQNSESQAGLEPVDPSSLSVNDHEKVASSETLFLRPCNSNMEARDIASGSIMPADAAVQCDVTAFAPSETEETRTIGKEYLGPDKYEEIPKVNYIQEHTLQEEIHATSSEPDRQVVNASAHDLPAPEKLLSVPEDIIDQHKNMLPEASPGVFMGLDEGDAGSKIISGKKRSFTESTLTEQSLNSVESSRLVRFKRTTESVPDDDDLLSSILVGRSSVLKVKPTPRLSEVTSTKRTRSAPRTGAPKRKVLTDETMVLHGDTIRQQLTSTEDIRRVRKKAPCTRDEISMIQKQYLEDEYFLEPIFTGVSTELTSLHRQMRDLSGITVYENHLAGASLEKDADLRLSSENLPSINDKDSSETMAEPILSANDVQNDGPLTNAAVLPLTSQNTENMGNDMESGEPNVAEQSEVRITNPFLLDKDSEVATSSENPLLSDSIMKEVDTINVEISTGEELTRPAGDVEANPLQPELLLDATGVETNDKNDDAPGPSADVQVNPVIDSNELNADMLGGFPDLEKNAPSVELDFAVMDADNGQAISRDDLASKDVDINAIFKTEPLAGHDLPEMAQGSASFELLSNSKQGQLGFDEHTDIHGDILGENIVDSSYPSHRGLEDGFMDNGGSAEQPEAYQHYVMEGDGSYLDPLGREEELQYDAAGIDTDFLNVDDDELNEIADDQPDDQEALFAENTGWSSRTRAVSKYLQTLFVKEAEHGRKSLSMDGLLVGKSRKEASRMFFEALVLKTRDYVHVEQHYPFEDVTLKPRTRLMKSDF